MRLRGLLIKIIIFHYWLRAIRPCWHIHEGEKAITLDCATSLCSLLLPTLEVSIERNNLT